MFCTVVAIRGQGRVVQTDEGVQYSVESNSPVGTRGDIEWEYALPYSKPVFTEAHQGPLRQ